MESHRRMSYAFETPSDVDLTYVVRPLVGDIGVRYAGEIFLYILKCALGNSIRP